jgi:hypothetical protein
VGAIGRISRNESCLGTLGVPADFAASAATRLDTERIQGTRDSHSCEASEKSEGVEGES